MVGVNIEREALLELLHERLLELGLEDAPERPGSPAPGTDLHMLAPTRDRLTAVEVKLKAKAGAGLVDPVESPGSCHSTTYTVIGLPRVSGTVRGRLRQRGVGYVDSGGNAWIDLPGFHVDVEGRRPVATGLAGADRPSRAFRPAGLRVVFAWLVDAELLDAPVRHVAAVTGVSVGAVSNTARDLEQEGLLATLPSGRRLPHPRRLTVRWVEHFATTLLPVLKSRSLTGPAPSWWMSRTATWVDDIPTQLGGEAAAEQRGYGIRATTTTFYGHPPWHALIREGRLKPGTTPNVHLRERFWHQDLGGAGNPLPSLLVYADLLASGDPRQRSAAEELWDDDADLRRLQQS